MSRIQKVENATGKQQELLEMVQKKLGRIPNMLAIMAQSPAALEAYLTLSEVLSGGALNAKVREQIALVVGEANSCEYCLTAHSAIGKMVGLSEEEVAAGRKGLSEDPKTAAILTLAKRIAQNRGNVSNGEFEEAKSAGITDGEIAEVVANVALNTYTNYFNHISDPEIDF